MDVLTFEAQRLVHLDFKGAPPKVSYLDKIFPLFRDWGATGLLIEWEDTFPYKDDLQIIGSLSVHAETQGSPYSVEEFNQILEMANHNGLSVIPLVQTFGHLEYVLKHEKWQGLREIPNYPSSMCPSHAEAQPLIRNKITQIVKRHENLQYIHIGADEVWHIGLCTACKQRMQSLKYGTIDLFLEHIVNLAQFIKSQYPSLKIIMWDDMLRNISVQILQEYNLGGLVEPMVWHYNDKITFNLDSKLWDKYSEIFSNVWIGTAYKGATGCTQVVPEIRHHISNHEAWLSILNDNVNKFENFRGVCFTGWSRYDHYAILCELLPAAIPSLVVCMKVWMSAGYNIDILRSASSLLGYANDLIRIESTMRPVQIPTELNFPGWQILVGVEWFLNLKTKIKNILECEQLETWLNVSNVRRNYTNPMQIEKFVPLFNELFQEINAMEKYLRVQFDLVFYPSLGDEWLETRLTIIKEQLFQMKADCETQVERGCKAHPTITKVITRQE